MTNRKLKHLLCQTGNMLHRILLPSVSADVHLWGSNCVHYHNELYAGEVFKSSDGQKLTKKLITNILDF